MKTVQIIGIGLEASSGAPMVLLREDDAPHRVLPIFVGGAEAASIAIGLSDAPSPRPLTHDLLATLVESLGGHVDHIEVTGLHNGTFIAEVALSGPTGDQRVDTRPSDAIALALRVDAPLRVADEVMDEAGTTLPIDDVDPEEIEAELDEFRNFLDEVDPDDFG
jgi:bifunctional DNase/RNase